MNKFFTTLAIAMVATMGIANAQHHFRIGPKAGLTGNWLPGTVLVEGERVMPNVGFYGGLALDWNLTEKVFLEGDLLYTQKGISSRVWTNNVNDVRVITRKYDHALGYVEIPLYIGYKIGEGNMSVAAGPEFCFNVLSLGKFTEYNYAEGTFYDSEKYSFSEYTKKFNVGLTAMLMYEFFEGFEFNLKFSYDFLGVVDITKTITGSNGRPLNLPAESFGRNMSLQFGFCYKFEL